jgi:hypothetical protein
MYHIIGADGKEYGPITLEQLKQWIAAGRINAETRVKPDSDAEWRQVRSVPELASLTTPAAATPPALPGVPKTTTGMAIASLICSLLGFLTCGITALVGLVLGIIALVRISNSKGRLSGNGFALGGIAVASILIFLGPIMAAILLPAFARAKERAQSIQCQNNAKQLALAVHMYAADNNEKFPTADKWCDLIEKYAASAKVFQCASDNARSAFGINANIGDKAKADVSVETVMIFEGKGWNANGGLDVFEPHNHSERRIVVGFADGSVRLVQPSELDTLRWEP